jgi:hypothetical protein
MRSTTGQIRGNDLACVRVNRKVQLPPGPSLRWLPQIADVNPEAGAVDEQVDRSVRQWPAELNVTELRQPPRQRGVIWNREIDLE